MEKKKCFIMLIVLAFLFCVLQFFVYLQESKYAKNNHISDWDTVVKEHLSQYNTEINIIDKKGTEKEPIYVCQTQDSKKITFEARCYYSTKELIPGWSYNEGKMCVDSIKSFSDAINNFVLSQISPAIVDNYTYENYITYLSNIFETSKKIHEKYGINCEKIDPGWSFVVTNIPVIYKNKKYDFLSYSQDDYDGKTTKEEFIDFVFKISNGLLKIK